MAEPPGDPDGCGEVHVPGWIAKAPALTVFVMRGHAADAMDIAGGATLAALEFAWIADGMPSSPPSVDRIPVTVR